MTRNSQKTRTAVADQTEQALSCASGEVIMGKCRPLFFLCALCVLCGCLLGCSVTRGTRAPDGSLTVVNYRLLWSSEAVDFSVAQPSTLNSQPRFTARLKIGKSATDDEAVSAITAGVVKGLTRP